MARLGSVLSCGRPSCGALARRAVRGRGDRARSTDCAGTDSGGAVLEIIPIRASAIAAILSRWSRSRELIARVARMLCGLRCNWQQRGSDCCDYFAKAKAAAAGRGNMSGNYAAMFRSRRGAMPSVRRVVDLQMQSRGAAPALGRRRELARRGRHGWRRRLFPRRSESTRQA